MSATKQRVQRIDTKVGGHRVIALRYRISTDQFCPWLIAIGEAARRFDEKGGAEISMEAKQ